MKFLSKLEFQKRKKPTSNVTKYSKRDYLAVQKLTHPHQSLTFTLIFSSFSDNYTLQINPNSGLVNENHLDYFLFIGRIVAMAAYHNRLIDGFFIRPFYKMMLQKPILLADIEAVDGEYYKSLKFIMETDDVDSLDLTFTSEVDIYGQKIEHELKENGKNIKVTKENRKEFIEYGRSNMEFCKYLDGYLIFFSIQV
jgi:hypothetical protein